jgi:hypothetical protein
LGAWTVAFLAISVGVHLSMMWSAAAVVVIVSTPVFRLLAGTDTGTSARMLHRHAESD